MRAVTPGRRRARTWAAGLLGGTATASGVALTATSGWLIVRASEQPVILTLLTAIVAVRAFGMARPVFRYWERLVSHDAALASLAARRSAAYASLIPLTPARLGRRRRADVLTAVVHDLSDEVEADVRVTVPVIASAVAGAVAIALTAALAPVVTLVLAVMAGFVAAVCVATLRLESRFLTDLLAARAEASRVSELVTSQADELRAVGGWSTAERWLDEAHAALARATRRASVGRSFAAASFPALIGAATMVVALVVAGLDVTGPVRALLVLTPVAVTDAVVPLADAMRAKAQASAAASRTRALLAQDPAVTPTATAPIPPAPRSGAGQRGGLGAAGRRGGAGAAAELRGVGARWSSGSGRLDLAATDLELRAGERVAIVGPNGSGKSTLLAVLARQLDPASGTYSLDGSDVLGEPLETTRARVAVVDDEPHVLATSLRNNLTLARPDASDDAVRAALERAGLGPLLAALPDGLDTVLGTGGRGVSGGERARLGIARAILSDRPLLLLDEPVAHLDPTTARAVLDDLFADDRRGGVGADRTVVMVTHRSEGLEHVDRTVELGLTQR